ncbi:zinc ribbon domain-containing protein [Actinoplanes sp. NEAU-A12]|uniref:Zinc ribbon domain-containing protein n=1 Tax=Actinoplanes sandaracinus TaxID=3045177 RepID=A0ABT6WJC9_9ACTN|nr:FmdB family zinc ribbon protein [Actinoplanes sandaracinus]MDI6099834.1 zinc ribbon domain-containing protein [Actinoplanes sandaracinus]
MPTYQYACTECGEHLEAVQSFSDPALTECPNCQGKLRKVFNSVGIVFKGSGFYRNDSRSGNVSAEKSGSGSGESAAKKSETSTTSSSDSSSSTTTSSSSTASSSSSSGSTSSSTGSGAKTPAAT